LAAKAGWEQKRDAFDLITAKLLALHFYQFAMPRPKPPAGSYDVETAKRGEAATRFKRFGGVQRLRPDRSHAGSAVQGCTDGVRRWVACCALAGYLESIWPGRSWV
jgi:hypothetical protein